MLFQILTAILSIYLAFKYYQNHRLKKAYKACKTDGQNTFVRLSRTIAELRLDNETAREDLAVISSSNDSLSNLNKGLEEDIKNLITIKTELEQKHRASERRLQFIATKYPHLIKQIKVA